MTITLVYETHSTTLDNEAGIATGWLPGELSEQGLRQAVALGQRRRADGIDLVVTSDLARAVDTVRDGSRVLLVSHSANRWALALLLDGLPLRLQVDAPFVWRTGWEYSLPVGWAR
jgi:Histidine phosphatase superfamily (branch 1)